MDTQTGNYVTGDPAFAVDRCGIIVLWNEAAEKAFGYSAPEALGEKCWRLLSGKDTYGNRHCCRHCPIREMAFNNEPVNGFHSIYNTASGQPRQFAVSCLSILDYPDKQILLHICRPEDKPLIASTVQPIARKDGSDHTDALSKREIEILQLLAVKTSTRDIATRLDISIRTVRTHIQHLMYKLQVHKRIEAIQEGKRLNLI